MIKKGVINVLNPDDGDKGDGDDDDDESSGVEEIDEFPQEVDGAPVNYGFDMIDEELEEDAESEEDPNVDNSILESWKGDFDKFFWINKFQRLMKGKIHWMQCPILFLNCQNVTLRIINI